MADTTAFTMFLSSIIGGAIGASVKLVTDEFGYKMSESREANKKLNMYAKPLWKACQELKFRLEVIYDHQALHEYHELEPLRWSPSDASASSLSWYNKDGQFVMSTAYLLAVVSSWIVLLQRDIGFLRFSKKTATTEFYRLIEDFKCGIADNGSILYYNFYEGIGAKLVVENEKIPMSIDRFCERTFNDILFRTYFEQLYNFLHEVAQGKYTYNLTKSISALQDIMRFLIQNGAIPEIGKIRPQDQESDFPAETYRRAVPVAGTKNIIEHKK
jgi:hypothetical protein